MTSPTESANVRLYKLRYSRTLLSLEILLIASVYATLLVFNAQYELWPSFIVVTLLSIIFFLRFSIVARFPHGLQIEFRSEPDRLLCYHRSQRSSYPLTQVTTRMTRWTLHLKLGQYPDTVYLPLLRDSFEQASHYAAFRRHLLAKQE